MQNATIVAGTVSVKLERLVKAIEKYGNPELAYNIMQEIGINYDPGYPAQSWDKWHGIKPEPNPIEEMEEEFQEQIGGNPSNIPAFLYHIECGDR